MGPLENELIDHVREIRVRLRESKPAYTDKTKELMLEVALLKNKLAAAEKEVVRLCPKGDSEILSPIIDMVSKSEGVPRVEVLSKRRKAKAVLARHICFYLAEKHTYLSMPAIARVFHKADHTTVIYGRDRITAMRLASDSFDSKIRRYESLM